MPSRTCIENMSEAMFLSDVTRVMAATSLGMLPSSLAIVKRTACCTSGGALSANSLTRSGTGIALTALKKGFAGIASAAASLSQSTSESPPSLAYTDSARTTAALTGMDLHCKLVRATGGST
jgi:hypothetical protein|tara:strand:+ start:322 stop:687 length:366 start_codon:yes stop_codon:yes gene_type:complete